MEQFFVMKFAGTYLVVRGDDHCVILSRVGLGVAKFWANALNTLILAADSEDSMIAFEVNNVFEKMYQMFPKVEGKEEKLS